MSYTAIASQTLGSSASSVTFSSIPGTFRDLVLVVNAWATSGSNQETLRFNSNSSGYNMVTMRGDGSATSSFSYANQAKLYVDGNNNSISTSNDHVSIVQILDYAQTDKHKSVLWRSDTASISTVATAGRWANTAAITSLEIGIEGGGGNFAAGSTFSLFGVSA